MSVSRRRFLQDSTKITAGVVAASAANSDSTSTVKAADEIEFRSTWQNWHDRPWLGAEYWANPLQDWRLKSGRIECHNAAYDRNVHLLTRDLGTQQGTLEMRVRLGRPDRPFDEGKGSAGFRIGIQGPLEEYRNSLIFGSGLNTGVTADGGLFIGNIHSAKKGTFQPPLEIELRLMAEPRGDTYRVTLAVHHPGDGKELAKISRDNVPGEQLIGNLALVANFGNAPGGGNRARAAANRNDGGAGTGTFWFADWQLRGSKLAAHDDRAFGPIMFSHYSLSDGVMKLTAQMAPVGASEPQTVGLQFKRSGQWVDAPEVKIHPEARTATFRIDRWSASDDVEYRVRYTSRSKTGRSQEHFWTGTVRRDPVDQPVLTVADVCCNIHATFPNAPYVANMAKLNPDFLAFVGDQFYESSGGYGVIRTPVDLAILDYLRKWYMHGWTWRELARDRPSISLPDDHDVYQGNVWGEGGAPRTGTQEMGGYDMDPAWVNVVHRTQTSHHPDPYDPTPIKQGIIAYYGPLTYGGVSFAVLADRMFKSGPQGKVPPTGGRGDHVTDPNFDPSSADVPGAQLLGERQMKFLREWVEDWRGAEMKAILSQTTFTAMATTHGGNRERLRADYDTNGWPQTPRNDALKLIRQALAVHIAGDQHLPALVHYGIDMHRDGPVAFAGPAINVGYPRWFEPTEPGKNRAAGAPANTGDFTDHFGHPMTVIAVANGAIEPRKTPMEAMQDKASGLGIVRFNKPKRQVTFECWPFLADPSQPGTQFPGWPVTVDALDNYGGPEKLLLPTIEVQGAADPLLEVVRESDGETLYRLRIAGTSFQPRVFAAGNYTVRVIDTDKDRRKEVTGLVAAATNDRRQQVAL
jgi:phosphodiesterase/alkaline phosphatase D-like protein